jgi:hypothetical protein
VGFEIASYDPTRPLVIDPVISYSTYLGGSDADFIEAIAVDAAGNTYAAGWTDSLDFPTANALQPLHAAGQRDAFVVKLSADGGSLVYATYLGGGAGDEAHAIAVDATGNAYIAGSSGGSSFPVVNPVQPEAVGGLDAFVAKLSPQGSALVYSTFLGGRHRDRGGRGRLRLRDWVYGFARLSHLECAPARLHGDGRTVGGGRIRGQAHASRLSACVCHVLGRKRR